MKSDFHWADWLVFGAMLLISLAIAVINYFVSRKKKEGVNEFLMGSRKVPILPTAMSLMASFVSSITIIGYPAQVYLSGATFFFAPVGLILGGIATILFAVPLIYPLKLNSINEYLEQRYNSRLVRKAAAYPSILGNINYTGIVIFGTCVTLETMVGFPVWKGILVVGTLGTLPTVIAGLKGVIWMDFFQSLVMFAAVIAILVGGSFSLGGMDKAVDIFTENHARLNLSSDHRQFTVWGALLGNFCMWFSVMGFSQGGLQRYGAVSSLKRSRIVMSLGLLIQGIIWVFGCLCGVIVYSFYAGRGCDVLGPKLVRNVNGLVPDIVQRVLSYPAVPGLFLAAVFCGNYSSVTSSLTGIAANLWEDVLKDWLGGRSEVTQLVVVRGGVCLAGLLSMAVAYGCSYVGSSMVYLSYAFLNSISGPLFGLFILSAVFELANAVGALSGLATSFLFMLWMAVGGVMHVDRRKDRPPFANVTCPLADVNVTQPSLTSLLPPSGSSKPSGGLLQPLYEVEPIWFSVIGAAVCLFVGLLVSLCTLKCVKRRAVSASHLFEFVRPCRCLPSDDRDSPDHLKYEYRPQPVYDPDAL